MRTPTTASGGLLAAWDRVPLGALSALLSRGTDTYVLRSDVGWQIVTSTSPSEAYLGIRRFPSRSYILTFYLRSDGFTHFTSGQHAPAEDSFASRATESVADAPVLCQYQLDGPGPGRFKTTGNDSNFSGFLLHPVNSEAPRQDSSW